MSTLQLTPTSLPSLQISLPWQSLSSSCRAQCSGWSPPAGPSQSWPPGRFLDEGTWLRTPPVWDTGERPLGAHRSACGQPGDHHHCHWCASPVRYSSPMSFVGPKGGWDPRWSRLRSFYCSGRQRGTGPHRMVPPLMKEEREENSLLWKLENEGQTRGKILKSSRIRILPNALPIFHFLNVPLM